MEVKDNTLVKLSYTGTLEDGSVFDTSEGREPLEFIFGSGMIIQGLEEGIKGLKKGDKKEVKVVSEKAYGPRHDEAVQEVPKEHMPSEVDLKEGMQLMAQGPHGAMPVVIAKVSDSTVTVDFNHPLAGKDLTFNVEVDDVKEATEEDKKKFMPQQPQPHEHGEGCGNGQCGSHSDEKKENGECCQGGTCKK